MQTADKNWKIFSNSQFFTGLKKNHLHHYWRPNSSGIAILYTFSLRVYSLWILLLSLKNPRPAWYPSQCNMDITHTVCRCCCNTDGCNSPQLPCLGGE